MRLPKLEFTIYAKVNPYETRNAWGRKSIGDSVLFSTCPSDLKEPYYEVDLIVRLRKQQRVCKIKAIRRADGLCNEMVQITDDYKSIMKREANLIDEIPHRAWKDAILATFNDDQIIEFIHRYIKSRSYRLANLTIELVPKVYTKMNAKQKFHFWRDLLKENRYGTMESCLIGMIRSGIEPCKEISIVFAYKLLSHEYHSYFGTVTEAHHYFRQHKDEINSYIERFIWVENVSKYVAIEFIAEALGQKHNLKNT